MTIKAIETTYKGVTFRSRLEARWAVFFDALEIEWEYEKEGFALDDGTNYLPDFWLPQVRMWAEVKGQDFTQEEVRKCELLAAGTGRHCLMLNGAPDGRVFWAATGWDERNNSDEISGERFVDYAIHSCERYWITERRFYACTGDSYPNQSKWPDDIGAVEAARAARFWEPRA